MPRSRKPPTWGTLKQHLAGASVADLMKILRDLHDLSPENRHFLETRFLAADGDIDRYRQQVGEAIYPDPFDRRPISIAAAKGVIRQYELATGDPLGTLDLRLTFVEQGTAQALDLGYGEERYFASLESMLTVVLDAVSRLPDEVRDRFLERLARLADAASHLGWGYGAFVSGAVADVVDRSR